MSTKLARAELVLREEGIAYGTSKVTLKKAFLRVSDLGLSFRGSVTLLEQYTKSHLNVAICIFSKKSVHYIHQLLKVSVISNSL